MRLKAKTQIKNRVVNMLIETTDFTNDENNMLDQVGEPLIYINKSYGPNPIKIEKKVRSGFRVMIKFDGNLSENMEDVNGYADELIEDINLKINEAMNIASLDYSEALNSKKEKEYDQEIKVAIPTFK